MRQVFNLQNWCVVKVQGGVGSALYKQCMKNKNKNNNIVKPEVKHFAAEELFKLYLKNTL